MERRGAVPALDGVDQSWVRGTTLHLLSAAFVDAGSSIDTDGGAAVGAGCVYRANANLRRAFGVPAAETVDQQTSGYLGVGVLCDESKRAADDLYPQRFCGTTGLRDVSAASAGGA